MAEEAVPGDPPVRDDTVKILIMLVGSQVVLLGIALFASRWTGVWPLQPFAPTGAAILTGIAAGLFLYGAVAFSRILMPEPARRLDEQALEIFGTGSLRLTAGTILLLSMVAGIFEEIVFRGALQGWLVTEMALWAALGLQALVFALLHPVNRLYVAYVFLIGLALGILFHETGNLVPPIIAHILFDILALARLKRLAEARLNRLNGPR